MLPDFPVQKTKLLRLWTDYWEQKQREYLGFFAGVPSYTHHEGDLWGVEMEDGTPTEIGYQAVETAISFNTDEIPHLTPDKVARKLDRAAQDMARQVAQDILKRIGQTVTEGGANFDAKGQRLTKELFLQVLDSMLLPFDDKGDLIPPTILMHPKVWETYKDDMKSWEEDPEFNARFDEIIEQKREVWRDRESRRKLVD